MLVNDTEKGGGNGCGCAGKPLLHLLRSPGSSSVRTITGAVREKSVPRECTSDCFGECAEFAHEVGASLGHFSSLRNLYTILTYS